MPFEEMYVFTALLVFSLIALAIAFRAFVTRATAADTTALRERIICLQNDVECLCDLVDDVAELPLVPGLPGPVREVIERCRRERQHWEQETAA